MWKVKWKMVHLRNEAPLSKGRCAGQVMKILFRHLVVVGLAVKPRKLSNRPMIGAIMRSVVGTVHSSVDTVYIAALLA